jgi:ATP-dependent protease HslVU (ClpYQ) ATPase subunit
VPKASDYLTVTVQELNMELPKRRRPARRVILREARMLIVDNAAHWLIDSDPLHNRGSAAPRSQGLISTKLFDHYEARMDRTKINVI